MPRVSVITPAHNSERYIEQALQSVFRQTYSDWELLVVDDASSDGTVEAVEQLACPRMTLLRSERNVGPAAARNLALDEASGELVAFLDADDWWERDFLIEHVRAFEEGGDRVGIVTGDARIVTPNGFEELTYRSTHAVGREVSLDRLLSRNPIFISSMVSRSAVEEAGRFDESIWGAEDFDLWIRIVELGYRVLTLARPLAAYRRHPSALTASQATAARSEQLAYTRALQRGRLTARQKRIAQRRIRYNRAVQAVAEAFEPGGDRAAARRRLRRELPLLMSVALAHPGLWPSWAKAVGARLAAR